MKKFSKIKLYVLTDFILQSINLVNLKIQKLIDQIISLNFDFFTVLIHFLLIYGYQFQFINYFCHYEQNYF